jgi:hypothetical protein
MKMTFEKKSLVNKSSQADNHNKLFNFSNNNKYHQVSSCNDLNLSFDPDKKLRSYEQINPLKYFTKILGHYFFVDDHLNDDSTKVIPLGDSSLDSIVTLQTQKKGYNNDSIYKMPLRFWFRFKSQPCRRWNIQHSCEYGKQCWYYHDENEQIRLDWEDIGCVTTHHNISPKVLNNYNHHYYHHPLQKQQQQQLTPSQKTVLHIWYCSFGCKNEESCHHHCLFYQTLMNITDKPLSSLVSKLHPSFSSVLIRNLNYNQSLKWKFEGQNNTLFKTFNSFSHSHFPLFRSTFVPSNFLHQYNYYIGGNSIVNNKKNNNNDNCNDNSGIITVGGKNNNSDMDMGWMIFDDCLLNSYMRLPVFISL